MINQFSATPTFTYKRIDKVDRMSLFFREIPPPPQEKKTALSKRSTKEDSFN